MDNLNLSRKLSLLAVVLAFVVVILGAYTRLTDAGLGCPDWPGCYGHWVVPETPGALQQADLLYPKQPVEAAKAWAEMIHRYAAFTLGLLILVLAVVAIFRRAKGYADHPLITPLLLVALVIFQAALGRWTVTLQLLPVVVMGHLLGGILILALLWLLVLMQGKYFQSNADISHQKFRFWALLGVLIVLLQISLGGWTSTNYAALACADFPTCHGQWLPLQAWREAFNVFMPVGMNFEGGVLDSAARVTIQAAHRLGALITACYLFILSLAVIMAARGRAIKMLGVWILVILGIQLILGMLNVLMLLPLKVAILHNAFAALLFISLVTLSYALYANPHRKIR